MTDKMKEKLDQIIRQARNNSHTSTSWYRGRILALIKPRQPETGICAYCGQAPDAAMLVMGNSMAHDKCVVRELNKLLDPDYDGSREAAQIVGYTHQPEPPQDKVKAIVDLLTEEFVICLITHENPPPRHDCYEECGVSIEDQIASSNPIMAPMRSEGKKHKRCMDCWSEYIKGLAHSTLSIP